MTTSEEPAPYGAGRPETGPTEAAQTGSGRTDTGQPGTARVKRVRTHHLRDWKERGERFTMLTTYDQNTARIFDEAGIDTLLVGDSAGNNVFGYDTTLPVTVDELIPLTRAVAGAVRRALVVADLPFGSYQASPEQAYLTAVRFMKEGGAAAVKLEGGAEMAPTVQKLVQGGIPVCGHVGFTPQSEHALGGYRVQGRGDSAERVKQDARAIADAGAFAIVMEMVPGDVAREISNELAVPTIGIGAGNGTDGQVLVWTDAMGMRNSGLPRFVKQYADLERVLRGAARAYAEDVRSGSFPAPEHTF